MWTTRALGGLLIGQMTPILTVIYDLSFRMSQSTRP
jgi:hypothetical protein